MIIHIYNGKKGVPGNCQFICVTLLPLMSLSLRAKELRLIDMPSTNVFCFQVYCSLKC